MNPYICRLESSCLTAVNSECQAVLWSFGLVSDGDGRRGVGYRVGHWGGGGATAPCVVLHGQNTPDRLHSSGVDDWVQEEKIWHGDYFARENIVGGDISPPLEFAKLPTASRTP